MDDKFSRMVNEQSLEIAEEAIVAGFPTHLLVLDDEQPVDKYLLEFYKGKPVKVFSARTPGEADLILRQKRIDMAYVDIDLGAGGESGEAWLFRNRDLLVGVEVRVLTGKADKIKNRTQLNEIISGEIEVKGEPDTNIWLWENPIQFAFKRARHLLSREAAEQNSFRDRLMTTCVEMFSEWAQGLGKESDTVLFASDRPLTVAEMIEEVRHETPVGRTLLRLFVEDKKEYP